MPFMPIIIINENGGLSTLCFCTISQLALTTLTLSNAGSNHLTRVSMLNGEKKIHLHQTMALLKTVDLLYRNRLAQGFR